MLFSILLCVFCIVSQTNVHLVIFRIQKDAIDHEKLKETLSDEQFNEACDMRKAVEMVALLEALLKDLSPNLDSIAEYELMIYTCQ